MKKNNILQVALHMGPGGLENVVLDLINNLDKRKYNSHFLCLDYIYNNYEKILKDYGIPFSVIKKNGRYDITYYRQIMCLIREKKIDIIHAHSGCFFDAMISAKMTGVKGLIYTAHGIPIWSNTFMAFVKEVIAGIFADKVIAVSPEISDYLTKNFYFSKRKIDVILNGVDINKYRPRVSKKETDDIKRELNIPLNRIIIGSVGRLDNVKNYSILIKVFKQLTDKQDKKLCLVLIGDGSERTKLELLCKNLHIEEFVYFLGIRNDISSLIRIFDVFALPSFTEGTSISLLEAQASGIPAVVTNVGGNSLIIHNGYNGYLCRSNDPNDLCEKLIMILNTNLKAYSFRSRERAEKLFSLQSVLARYKDIYEEIVFK